MAPYRLTLNRFGLKIIDQAMIRITTTIALSLILVFVPLSVKSALGNPVSYLGVEASRNFSCKFYPMMLSVDDNNIGIVHSPG